MTTKTTRAENGVCTALANHGDGTFGKWCVERCGMTTQTARNYIAVIEVFGAQKQLVCKSLLQSFTAEALYYLSRDTTPEEAIRDALKLAKKGERVEAVVRDDPEALAAWREAMKLQPGPKDSSVDNVTRTKADKGNSRSYTVSRLQKQRPDLFERVKAGELSETPEN